MDALLHPDAGPDHSPIVPLRGGGTDRPDGVPTRRQVLKDILDDAICLLEYAAEAGIVVEAELAQRIIEAGQRGDAAWADASAGSLLNDITRLGALLHPVTAVTLRATKKQAHKTIESYKRIAITLAAFVVPWSLAAFVFANINTSITNDIAIANQLVVSLHAQIEAPAAQAAESTQIAPINALSDLQEFASTMRSIYRHTQELIWFVPGTEKDPVKKGTRLELDTNLSGQIGPMRKNLDELTDAYQQIRSFAKYAQDDGAAACGAVTTCILPILYALLGACAYLLRIFSGQLTTRTFAPSYSTIARFVIASIAGGIVGLFNNFGTGQLATLSPLAIAFVAGYAADVFFSFIDGAVQVVSKPTTG
jgi:hypothetical protein